MTTAGLNHGVRCRVRAAIPARFANTQLPVQLLVLPMPGKPYACPRPHAAQEAWRWPVAIREVPSPPTEERERSWYRWLLGHQASFCVWRLMCDELSALSPEREDADGAAAMDRVAELYDGYSALLLYSGSCTPEIYHSVVRHNMVSVHLAFSGTWARDYERTLTLLSEHAEQRSPALMAALKTNRLTHMAVAKRLVPSGNSLLREAGAAHAPVTETDRQRLDAFFGTARGAVCREDLTAGLRRRVAAILRDVEQYPLNVTYGRPQIDALQDDVAFHLNLLGATAAVGPH